MKKDRERKITQKKASVKGLETRAHKLRLQALELNRQASLLEDQVRKLKLDLYEMRAGG